mmetsp:Transcript_39953/g.127782  ORF Transcript_39953/g.127782 Transcript_39953/m.127782 type:complete len:352 (+) Transcript_39953:155-1210(+)
MVYDGTAEEHAAASRIQAKRRGANARRELREKEAAAVKLQSNFRGHSVRKEAKERQEMDERWRKMEAGRKARQQRLHKWEQEYALLKDRPARDMDAWERERENKAATTVQAYWKGRQAQQGTRPAREQRERAAGVIQRSYRRRQGRTPRSARRRRQGGEVDDNVSMSMRESSGAGAGADAAAARQQLLESQVARKRAAYLASHLEPPGQGEVEEVVDKVDSLFQTHKISRREAEAKGGELRRTQREAALMFTRLQQGAAPGQAAVPPEAKLEDFPLPRGEGMERARKAHARSLAEARMHDKWWKPLVHVGGGESSGGDPKDPLSDWDGAMLRIETKWAQLEQAERDRPVVA